MKVGSGFCPFLCVRRLAECDASLLLKEEPSLPPKGGFFKTFLMQERLVKKSAEYSLDFGQSPAMGLLPYLFEKRPQIADNAAIPGPQAENHGRGRKKNATMQGCCGKVLQCCNLHLRQRPEPVFAVLPGNDVGDTLFCFVHSPAGDSFVLCSPEHIFGHNLLTTS